jgi:hypothetical protein
MIRAAVPEKVAMTISEHKTRSVIDRYNIVNEADRQGGAQKIVTVHKESLEIIQYKLTGINTGITGNTKQTDDGEKASQPI